MKTKVINIFAIICVAIGGFLFHSCSDKDYYDPTKVPGYVDPNPSTLDFSTDQNVTLQLNYEIGDGFVAVFDLYTAYPLDSKGMLREDITPLARGINIVGVSKLSRVIPAYVTKLYAYSSSLFVPTVSYAEIQNGIASFEAMDVEITETGGTRAGNAGTFGKKPITKFLKSKEDFYQTTENGHFKFDLKEPDDYKELPTEVATAISKAFPESKIVDEKYYKDATITINKGKDGQQGAEVFVSVLHGGGSFNSSLSYFVYEGNLKLSELSPEIVENLEVINIFQYADVHTNSKSSKKNQKGLTPGNYVQLLYKNKDGEYVKEFPVGAQIGWILHPHAFDEASFTVKDRGYAPRLFSVSYWNEATNKTKDPNVKTNNFNIFFSTTDNSGYTYNCFGFEDQPNSGSNDGDCNDVIFHILTNPVDAVTSPPNISDEDIVQTENKQGILAFEDNWPQKGDYDLNDVVLKYSSDITYLQRIKKQNGVVIETTDVMVTKVEDTFSFIHNGARFKNMFSYKVDISPDNVSRITVTDELTGNNTDYTGKIVRDGDGFIIDLAYNTLPQMENGATARSYKVKMEFKDEAVLQDDFVSLSAPYNPFIKPEGNFENAEVHLPMYFPTSRINEELFGTHDDRSDKKTLWFVSGENIKYPFAIHLTGATEFRIPKEENEISTTYPNYLKWVESGMTDYKDWYK